MGGVSGNAGLFSAAQDLHRFAQGLLKTGESAMFANQSPKSIARTIGLGCKLLTTPQAAGWISLRARSAIPALPAPLCGWTLKARWWWLF
jgi:hypothetical protein